MSFPVTLRQDDMHALESLPLLPIRQMVIARGPQELAFASQGLFAALSRPERFRILRHGAGGQILARNDPALAEAQNLLRQAYGEAIAFGTPTIHTAC